MRKPRSSAETYLQRIRYNAILIRGLIQELHEARISASGLSGIDYSRDRVQSSATSSPLENAYIRASDRINNLEHQISTLMEERDTAIDQIQSLQPREYSMLLSLLFIEGRSPIQVQDEMGYSDSWYWHARRHALKTFSDNYNI